ncbi:MAG: NAD(P)/FAD-dependent oxidoreductase, partial [Acidimicrobiales bacterium]
MNPGPDSAGGLGTVVVVGASLAGLRAVETLRRDGFAGRLFLVGAEEHFPPYDRPPLSKEVLTGAWEPERARLRIDDGLDVELLLGRRAVALDLGRREVTLAGGEALGFDGLVVATGAAPRRLAGVDDGLGGVAVLRTVEDCLALRDELDKEPAVVVIGAGFIGCEVASACRSRGLEVTVVEALPLPLVRVLGQEMSEMVVGLHRDHGVGFRLGVPVAGLRGSGRVEEVLLGGGTALPADLVVVAMGVVPETGWLAGSGLAIGDGVLLDESCTAVGVDRVVAAGDVARWHNPVFGESMRVEHWTNAAEQGEAAASSLLRGREAAEAFRPVPYFWSDQHGSRIQFVGV